MPSQEVSLLWLRHIWSSEMIGCWQAASSPVLVVVRKKRGKKEKQHNVCGLLQEGNDRANKTHLSLESGQVKHHGKPLESTREAQQKQCHSDLLVAQTDKHIENTHKYHEPFTISQLPLVPHRQQSVRVYSARKTARDGGDKRTETNNNTGHSPGELGHLQRALSP